MKNKLSNEDKQLKEITFINDLGEEIIVKNGFASYILFQFLGLFGLIISMIISNKRSQFRIANSSLLLLSLIDSILYIMFGRFVILLRPIFIYIIFVVALRINAWTMNDLISKGYKVKNPTEQTDEIIASSKKIKYPIWLIIK